MKDEIIIRGDVEEFSLEGVSLGDLSLAVLKAQENKICQIDAETKEELRANLLANRSILISKWFDKIGLKIGDSVAVCSENRIEFISVPIAAFFNGISYAGVNPEYTIGELEHCLNLSKPKVIFCSNKSFKTLLKLQEKFKFIRYIVVFDNVKIPKKNVELYYNIVQGAKESEIDDSFFCKSFDVHETVATILCSSGTTGMPKGVLCTHFNMLSFISISRKFYIDFANSTASITVGLVPFFHSMGFMSMFLNMLRGATFVFLKKFKPELFLQTVQDYKATDFSVPPPIILFLNKSPLVKKYDLSSVSKIFCGAAPLSRELEEATEKTFNLTHMAQAYGMTETTLGVLMNPMGGKRTGSVGKVLPGMEAKVINENGKTLGPREEGELCFRGPLIMKGYVGDPSATHTILDSEGWLHSGDVGYYDEDGYFFIVDRVKELIKYKGFQVAPAELEALLLSHPGIIDAAVVGLPDERAGELPLAFVVKKDNYKLTEKEVQDFIADKVSDPKKLRGGVKFVKEIPRNPSGKILRRVLKEKVRKLKSKL